MEATPAFMSRNLRIKSLALTCFLLIASFAAVASGEDAEPTARSTGTEEISIALSSSSTYFDRTDASSTTQFTATVT